MSTLYQGSSITANGIVNVHTNTNGGAGVAICKGYISSTRTQSKEEVTECDEDDRSFTDTWGKSISAAQAARVYKQAGYAASADDVPEHYTINGQENSSW